MGDHPGTAALTVYDDDERIFQTLCAGDALFKDHRPPEAADVRLTPHELRILELLRRTGPGPECDWDRSGYGRV